MDLKPFALAGLALVAGVAFTQTSGAQTSGGAYLSADRAPDTALILPAAPAANSPRAAADRAIFKATRAFKGSPRWSLAQNDVDEATPSMLADFSCAIGANLSEASAPKLAALLRRLRYDVVNAVNKPKYLYKRQRPYLVDKGDICVDKTPALALSPDYPSGHTTWGWTVGLVLAELTPDRATPVLVRARAFGESRVVCGVHNASAIEAGRTNAAALVAALHGDAAFRSDMDAVRAELAAVRAASPTNNGPPSAGLPNAGICAAEAAITGKAPW